MPAQRTQIEGIDPGQLMGASIWAEGDAVHIDVSALQAPDPFVATMKLLEHPAVGDLVVFHNDREPVHLFPELLDLGWSYHVEVDQPGSFRMSIVRVPLS